jgi:hypothetical protein
MNHEIANAVAGLGVSALGAVYVVSQAIPAPPEWLPYGVAAPFIAALWFLLMDEKKLNKEMRKEVLELQKTALGTVSDLTTVVASYKDEAKNLSEKIEKLNDRLSG